MDYQEFLKDTEYEIVEPYKNALTKINHRHKTCGFIWHTRPNDIKNRFKKGITTGCPGCGKSAKLTHEQYKERLLNTEFEALDSYINNSTPILHKHFTCGGVSKITPISIINQKRKGCEHCGKAFKRNTDLYKAKLVDTEYELLEEYTGSKDKLLHRHKVCGTELNIRPNDILSGHGCGVCSIGRGYSKISIAWLNSLENKNILHAESGGEQRCLGYLVDGYDPQTKTIYEFHGDKYHGNLDLFSSDSFCHPFDKSTTTESLWQKTFDKMLELSKRYTVVYIWENDYRKGKMAEVF